MRKKIACVVGARPQFIKHFPLELELIKKFNLITIHTGQHYDENMSRVFFDQLGIKKPDFHFQLTKSSHGGQTSEMLSEIEIVLIKENVDILLVYGDTNSTIAGALAAAKLNIPVVHIEAGLRSFNRAMPEEINRVLTDHVSKLMFCSSKVGVTNLKNEGIVNGVHNCGDLMKDALLKLTPRLKNSFDSPFTIATLHRPYNTDDPKRLTAIIRQLNESETKVVLPLHPRTRKILKNNEFEFRELRNVEVVEPVGYIDMLTYLKFADKVITDSGGVQKEAYWMRKKCITVRTETEWVETLTGNWNNLVFDNLRDIADVVSPDPKVYDENLYGNGNAAEEITSIIADYFKCV
jgi:UDP-GlcNAc3NAcA epimerase